MKRREIVVRCGLVPALLRRAYGRPSVSKQKRFKGSMTELLVMYRYMTRDQGEAVYGGRASHSPACSDCLASSRSRVRAAKSALDMVNTGTTRRWHILLGCYSGSVAIRA